MFFLLIALPFGFDLSIGQIQNNFNLSRGGQNIAGLSTVRIFVQLSFRVCRADMRYIASRRVNVEHHRVRRC